MSSVENIKQKYKIGQKTFEKLFKLNDQELKNIVKEIIEEPVYMEPLNETSSKCIRIIENGTPDEITICSYDTIKINWSGISYKPEHGSYKKIISFNKFFKLD